MCFANEKSANYSLCSKQLSPKLIGEEPAPHGEASILRLLQPISTYPYHDAAIYRKEQQKPTHVYTKMTMY